MIVEVGKEKYIIKWRHSPELRSTTCVISLFDNGINDAKSPLIIADAYLHPNDTYVKEIGRKVSLTKCLERTARFAANKEARKKVWEAYFNRLKV